MAEPPELEEPPELPQLSDEQKQLLSKCGDHVDLLLNCVLDCITSVDKVMLFIQSQPDEQTLTGQFAVLFTPMLRALQLPRAHCLCSPFGGLKVLSVSLSGSLMEGLENVSREVPGLQFISDSDVDVMYEFGPVSWATDGAGVACRDKDSSAELETILSVVATQNPGFVLLACEQRPGCQHDGRKMFSAEDVRRLMYELCLLHADTQTEITPTGPATSFEQECKNVFKSTGRDIVPCLKAPSWPSEEFFHRRRTCDWPPEAARDDILQWGVHLVPVGFHGSPTESWEWRLSFSRAEVVAARHLSQLQIGSLVAFKACRAALGPAGKVIKSYYLKTTLFWLCQEMPSDRWTSITRGLEMMLDYLEEAVAAGELKCFFWADINLLRPTTAAERSAMAETLALVRRHRPRLLAAELASRTAWFLHIILRLPPRRPSERELRVCLARCLMLLGVYVSLMGSLVVFNSLSFSDDCLALLLLSGASAELAFGLHCNSVTELLQSLMFRALAVAPPDVAGRCRLTGNDREGFTWDAAPLLELLTPDDLEEMLIDPSAVRDWLRSQHQLPPEQQRGDLPADLSTTRDLADLVLQPPLLRLVISCSVPCWPERFQPSLPWFHAVRQQRHKRVRETFEEVRRLMLDDTKYVARTANSLQLKLGLDMNTALLRAKYLKDATREFLDQPATRAEYDAIRSRLPDSWRLQKYAFR